MPPDPNRTTLIDRCGGRQHTGDVDELKGAFVLAGHSAGGGFATSVASDYIAEGSALQDARPDGRGDVRRGSNSAIGGGLAQQQILGAADKPIYQIAAPAQSWNLFGATTNVLAGHAARPVHRDGAAGRIARRLHARPEPVLIDLVLELVTKPVPAGNTAATYTLSSGWINDMYVGATPDNPQYGLYAASNQQIIMGPTAAIGLPAADPTRCRWATPSSGADRRRRQAVRIPAARPGQQR